MIRLDEAKHLYWQGKELVPSVTYVLRCTGVIPPVRKGMRAALARGRAVHKAIQLFDQGRLDFSTVDGKIEGWLRAYADWLGAMGARYTHGRNEVVVFDPGLQVAGRADKIARDHACSAWSVIEFKTGEEEAWHVLQVTAYWQAEFRRTGKTGTHTLVYLRGDGSWRQRVPNIASGRWAAVCSTFQEGRPRHMAWLKKLAHDEEVND